MGSIKELFDFSAFCYSKKLKKIMELPKEKREKKLIELLKNLGGSTTGLFNTEKARYSEHGLVDRILILARLHREEKIWILAFLSAIASILSALAAWVAVIK
jgi:hypothetical protein